MPESKTERYLEGQTAIVTGGASGIGAACAVELARRGAHVGINYISDAAGAEKIAQECRSHGVKAMLLQGDVSQPGEVDDFFGVFLSQHQRLDILIANAGIQKDASFIDLSYEEWEKVISVNLTGQYLCAQKAVQQFCKQGIRQGISKAAGKIIHMSSVHDQIPWAGHVNYAASKGGLNMLMKSIAQEVARHKIRVNAIAPGAIQTSINEEVWSDKEKLEGLKKIIPYERIGQPEEVAAGTSWLVSDYADYITGTTLYIDGGMTLYPGFVDNG